MNHIHRLQAELAAAQHELRAKADSIQDFRVHLYGEKFASPGLDGERRDWIATRDVLAWLALIANAGLTCPIAGRSLSRLERRRAARACQSPVRFSRRGRTPYTVTGRKRAAARRWQQRQRDALPLLVEMIAERQPCIEQVMEERVTAWDASEQAGLDRRAQ